MEIFFMQRQRKIYHSQDPGHYITASEEILHLSLACFILICFVRPSSDGSEGSSRKPLLSLCRDKGGFPDRYV